MKLLEYEAKEYFRKYDIPTPVGTILTRAVDAGPFVENLGKPVVIKAQVSVGGRGKAGGIRFANTPKEAVKSARQLLGGKLKGIPIKKLLIEEELVINEELYLGVTLDRSKKCYMVLASSEGGVNIEEVAVKSPEKIIRHPVDPILDFKSFHANNISRQLGYTGKELLNLSRVLQKLYRLAWDMDAELTEINPLVETDEGFIAADARLNVDNNALFRHLELKEKLVESSRAELTEKEIDARKKGLTYVELAGNIGIIGNGAGLTMATLDTVNLYGGEPGNFLDLGGGATPEMIEKAVEFVYKDPKINALFVNILGGMTRCDDIAEGIIRVRKKISVEKPIVVRMMGTSEVEGKKMLTKEGIDAFDSMEEAARQVVTLVKGE